MGVFKEYSKYYNLLYKDKDYQKEIEYILSIVNEFNPSAKTILNLGCGTGKHDFFLSKKGYTVTGVDMSDTMIAEAKSTYGEIKSLTFLKGDIRDVRIDKKYDVVVSLFHVMSYQISNEDLYKSFLTAKDHLKEDGVLIFDFWYGPAVLTDKPEYRIKELENEEIEVKRIAEPTLYPNENYVDVKYLISIKDKETGASKEIEEIHKMRYLFIPELELILNQAGFKIVMASEWLTKKKLSTTSWNGLVVCKIKS
jgi:SAM-dependent methyltransferase